MGDRLGIHSAVDILPKRGFLKFCFPSTCRGFSMSGFFPIPSARPSAKNPQACGLGLGLGCGLGFAFRKPIGGPSIYSLRSPLSSLENLPWGSIHHDTPSAFPQIVSMLAHTVNNIFFIHTVYSQKYLCDTARG